MMGRFKLYVLAIAALALVTIGASIVQASNRIGQDSPLSAWALQPSELPADSELVDAGPVDSDLTGLVDAAGTDLVQGYAEGYRVSALVPLVSNQLQPAKVGGTVYIGNVVYRFSDDAVAAAEFERWVALASAESAVSYRLLAATNGTRGFEIQATDSEIGNLIRWFVGVKGRVLMFVFVDGGAVAKPDLLSKEGIAPREPAVAQAADLAVSEMFSTLMAHMLER